MVVIGSLSFLHLETFRANVVLQLPGMIRVAGEEEDLVSFREGSDGLDGGGAAGGVHVGEGVVQEESEKCLSPAHLNISRGRL